MNPIIEFFQTVASQVPDFLQPVIIAAAGAIPFIEGELSSLIGVWAGMNPIVAGLAGAIGNFVCVTIIVLLGARARNALLARREASRDENRADEAAHDGAMERRIAQAVPGRTQPRLTSADFESVRDRPTVDTTAEEKPESKGRIKFKRLLNRFGVPGASLLGPLAIPTQITSTILAGAGVKTSWILLWQGIAILCWTTAATLISSGALVLLTV